MPVALILAAFPRVITRVIKPTCTILDNHPLRYRHSIDVKTLEKEIKNVRNVRNVEK